MTDNLKVPESQQWDYVENVLDDELGNQLEAVERKIELLDKQKSEILNSENSQNSTKVQKVVTKSKRNLINTRIKISADSTTVEILGPGCIGCPPLEANGNQSGDQVETQYPNTIRSYVAAMLAFFGNLRVEFTSDGRVYHRKLPVFYGNREKLLSIEQHEFEELMNGNTNFLPRASLVLDSMTYDQARQGNKNVAVNRELSMASLAGQSSYAVVTSAPSPYNITTRLNIVTRGMNDAMMLVEQVAAFFNPHYSFNLVDSVSGMESTVRLQLDSVMFEPPEIDQFSSNEVMVEFAFTLFGNMFKPRHKEFLAETITVNVGSL